MTAAYLSRPAHHHRLAQDAFVANLARLITALQANQPSIRLVARSHEPSWKALILIGPRRRERPAVKGDGTTQLVRY